MVFVVAVAVAVVVAVVAAVVAAVAAAVVAVALVNHGPKKQESMKNETQQLCPTMTILPFFLLYNCRETERDKDAKNAV